MNSQINTEIEAYGQKLLANLDNAGPSLFNKDWWYGQIMDWSMKHEHFKVQMFRFVDVFPYLHSSTDTAKHIREYFSQENGEIPSVLSWGMGLGQLAPSLMASAFKKNITEMAKMFITGASVADALPKLEKSRQKNWTATVDLLGEATLSEAEALEYQERYLSLIDELSDRAQNWPEQALIDRDHEGPIPKVNVSVKLTAIEPNINDVAWETSIDRIKAKLRPILRKAMSRGAFVNLDMEQYAHKDLTLAVFKSIVTEPEFANYPHFGLVIQAYLKDSISDIKALIEFAKKRRTAFTVRLVKGAYWDYETITASQKGWPCPVFTNKRDTDANYENSLAALIAGFPHVRLAVASHNVRSIAAAQVLAQKAQLPRGSYEVQMLYGMAEPIKAAIVQQGLRLREYATVGDLVPGMAYLVRRLLENTSNESFLRSKFADQQSAEVLLASPHDTNQNGRKEFKMSDVWNEPPLDFAIEEVRLQQAKALQAVTKKLGEAVPAVIDGRSVRGPKWCDRKSPNDHKTLVARFTDTDISDVELAIRSANSARISWGQTTARDRATKLRRLAALILENRYALQATEIIETGKPWKEADADITEAIDFCRYYADEAERLAQPERVGQVLGEVSHVHYVPCGVAAIIAPWNFPLAILCGMTTAALAAGNTVLIKPAEQSTWTGYRFFELLLQAGFPKNVIHFLPGTGETVGAALTHSSEVDLIAFTGSRQVGLEVIRQAAVPGMRGVKRTVVEMGGKNALIIDTDADLDEAIHGILHSSFGFQGQKCSALSRLIVIEPIYERLILRLVEAVKVLEVGPSDDPKNHLGPIIDQSAFVRISDAIKSFKADPQCQLLYESTINDEVGYFIGPHIFLAHSTDSALVREEIFGPVLAVIKAPDLTTAIQIANDSEYALTGGIYSRSPANIDQVRRELVCGNLYINRSITGALVNRHPFGGFKFSGLGSKSGGADYLKHFMYPRVITENLMRRGFAPLEA